MKRQIKTKKKVVKRIVIWPSVKNVIVTTIGGVSLLLCSIIVQAFFSSPPTRAEFDEFKAETIQKYESIDSSLTRIENKQNIILNHVIQGGTRDKRSRKAR